MMKRLTTDRLRSLALVAAGGFVGATARYGVGLALPTGFPWGTLTVNVAGSFALAVVLYEERLRGALGPETRLLVGTGFLSSFTTYSTFATETASLAPEMAILNVAANYGLGLLAVLAGRSVARRWLADHSTAWRWTR